jgi:hypothetical protein
MLVIELYLFFHYQVLEITKIPMKQSKNGAAYIENVLFTNKHRLSVTSRVVFNSSTCFFC